MSLVYSPNKEFHLGIVPGDVGGYCIICGDPGRVEHIAAYLDDAKQVAYNREFNIYTGTLEGEKVSVCSHGIGGPSTAIAMEELIHCGVHTVIRTGTAGGMAEEVEGGDVVIGTGAIRMEGTTAEYAPKEFPAVAHYQVIEALVYAAYHSKTRFHVGVLECKDNFYGQHSPDIMPVSNELKFKWNAYMECHTLASEMESAAVFIIGSVRKIRTGSIMMVLANQTRREKGLPDRVVDDVTPAIEISVEAMRRLILNDRSGFYGDPD